MSQKRYSLLILALVLVVGLLTAFGFWYGMMLIPALILGAILFVAVLAMVLQNPYAGAVGLVFLLPFERIPSVHLSSVTIRLSQVMLLVLVGGLVWRGLSSGKVLLRFSPYFYPYLLFLVTLLLSFLNMQAYSRGINVLIFTVFTSSVIWVIPGVVTSKTHLTGLTKALFISTIIICIFGMYQFFGDMIGLPTALTGLRELYTKVVFGFPRVQSTELEPLYLANFLIIPLSVGITLAIRKVEQFSIRMYLGVIILGGLVLLLTISRGGYVGIAASFFFIALSSSLWILRPRVVMGSIAIIVIVAASLIGLANYSQLGQRAVQETEKHFFNATGTASTLQRFGTYGQAEQAFSESPYVGIGIGNFGPWVANYPVELPKDGWAIVNNEPLELLAETGVVGFGAFVLLLAVLLIRSLAAVFRAQDEFLRALMLGLIAASVGVLTQYQFFSTLYVMHIWTLFALMIATQNVIFNMDHKT